MVIKKCPVGQARLGEALDHLEFFTLQTSLPSADIMMKLKRSLGQRVGRSSKSITIISFSTRVVDGTGAIGTAPERGRACVFYVCVVCCEIGDLTPPAGTL